MKTIEELEIELAAARRLEALRLDLRDYFAENNIKLYTVRNDQLQIEIILGGDPEAIFNLFQ